MAIKKIIFDVGQVLVKFNPKNLFLKILQDEEEVNFFLKNVCTWDWHIQQDLVYDTSKAAKPMVEKFPKYQEAIEAFYDRFLEMIPIIYQDNVNLALRLKKMGYSIYLLSNFPGDQFEKYRIKNNFIDEFNDRIISGDVGMSKPSKQIYQLAITKFNLIPSESLFIDDKIENIKGAESVGIKTIHLTKPEDLQVLIKKFIDL